MLMVSINSLWLRAQEMTINPSKDQSKTAEFLKLSGVVKSYEGDTIAKAVVIIPEIPKSIQTNENGEFEITAVPPGKYHIEVYAEGYVDFFSDPFDLTENMTSDIRLIKKLSEEIVVTATQTPKLYTEVPVKTEIITAREIEQKEASQLAESLSLITGVRVENNCQNCNFTQVRINGMEGKYSQILIDNSPVFSSMIGVYGLEQIPTEMLNRIEVVKGGGSALYGGNAVAGVINVMTKEPKENNTTIKLHQQSNQGEPYTNLGFRSSLVTENGNTKGFLFANYKRRQPVDLNEDNFSEIGRLRSTNFGLNFYQSFPRINGKLKLGFFRISEDRRGGDLFELPPHEAHIAEWINSDLLSFSSDWNHYLSERLYYNISLSHVQAERDTYYGAEKDLDAYGNTKNPVSFFNAQMNYQAGSHILSTGFQFKRENIKDQALGYNREIDAHYNELGFFTQDDVKLSETFSFLAGLRVSKHSLIEDLIFNPRMSLLINLIKDLSWRTTFSSGYRAPQVFNEDLHITQVGGEGMIIENSVELEEEKSYSVSTGFDFGKEMGTNLFQFSMEGFYTLLTNAFVLEKKEFDPRENAMVFERINGSNAKVVGISGDLGCRLGNYLSMSAGLTVQRSRLDEPEPDFGSRDFFRTPHSYGYASVNYQNSKIVHIDLSLEYTRGMKVPHFEGYIEKDRLETSKPFWVVNAKLKKSFHFNQENKVSVFLGTYNLLNSFQKDLDKGLYRDSGYVYGPMQPRSFYTGFEFSF
jgi:outer membrane receptor for ferrienterochelin and colicins